MNVATGTAPLEGETRNACWGVGSTTPEEGPQIRLAREASEVSCFPRLGRCGY